MVINGETINYSYKPQHSQNGTVYNYLRAYVVVSTDPLSGRVLERKEITAPNEDVFRQKINALQHARPLTNGALLPFGVYLEKWLVRSRLRLKSTTFSGYEYMLEHYILKHLKDYLISDISEDVMYDFYDTLMDDHGVSKVTNVYYLLSSSFTDAVQQFIIYSNPQENIRLPKVQKAPIIPLTQEECHKLIELSREDIIYGNAIALTLSLGLRISETIGLPIDAYDPVHKTLTIRRQINQIRSGEYILQNTTKNSIVRPLHLGDQAAQIIEEALAQIEKFKASAGRNWNNKYNCLFVNITGEFLKHNTLRNHLHAMCDKIGREDFKFHHLRHTCATIMLEETNNIFLVKEALGHNWLDSTATYTHTSPAKLKQAFTAISDFIG